MRFLLRSFLGLIILSITLGFLIFGSFVLFDALKKRSEKSDNRRFQKERVFAVNVETLEKEIWQHSSELETHTVETHIYRLRKKIKDEFGNDDLIKSNKNGYTI